MAMEKSYGHIIPFKNLCTGAWGVINGKTGETAVLPLPKYLGTVILSQPEEVDYVYLIGFISPKKWHDYAPDA